MIYNIFKKSKYSETTIFFFCILFRKNVSYNSVNNSLICPSLGTSLKQRFPHIQTLLCAYVHTNIAFTAPLHTYSSFENTKIAKSSKSKNDATGMHRFLLWRKRVNEFNLLKLHGLRVNWRPKR